MSSVARCKRIYRLPRRRVNIRSSERRHAEGGRNGVEPDSQRRGADRASREALRLRRCAGGALRRPYRRNVRRGGAQRASRVPVALDTRSQATQAFCVAAQAPAPVIPYCFTRPEPCSFSSCCIPEHSGNGRASSSRLPCASLRHSRRMVTRARSRSARCWRGGDHLCRCCRAARATAPRAAGAPPSAGWQARPTCDKARKQAPLRHLAQGAVRLWRTPPASAACRGSPFGASPFRALTPRLRLQFLPTIRSQAPRLLAKPELSDGIPSADRRCSDMPSPFSCS